MDRPAPVMDPVHGTQVSRPLEHLTPQERAVYQALLDNAGRVVSRA